MTKFAVILSGSGVYDGAEIHESVLTLLAIEKQGATYECFAPDIDQHHVINHLNGEEMDETRNVLVESARIARGNIKPLSDFNPADFDVLMLPGGFGAAKNLSSVAFDGPNARINGDVENAVRGQHDARKPIAALCISPTIVAKLIEGAKVTIGQDEGTIGAIEAMGSTHEMTDHGEITVDKANKVITSPCYMLDANIAQIAEGADNTVRAAINMVKIG